MILQFTLEVLRCLRCLPWLATVHGEIFHCLCGNLECPSTNYSRQIHTVCLGEWISYCYTDKAMLITWSSSRKVSSYWTTVIINYYHAWSPISSPTTDRSRIGNHNNILWSNWLTDRLTARLLCDWLWDFRFDWFRGHRIFTDHPIALGFDHYMRTFLYCWDEDADSSLIWADDIHSDSCLDKEYDHSEFTQQGLLRRATAFA